MYITSNPFLSRSFNVLITAECSIVEVIILFPMFLLALATPRITVLIDSVAQDVKKIFL